MTIVLAAGDSFVTPGGFASALTEKVGGELVQAQRMRRRWLTGLRNPNAFRPSCLARRL